MSTLLVHNHIPKNGGSFVRKLLKEEYKDKYFFAPSIEHLSRVDLEQDLMCLELHAWAGTETLYYEKFKSICAAFDEVKMFTCLRHPLARIASRLRDGRRSGGSWAFSPPLRLIKGPYQDFSYKDFKKSGYEDDTGYRWATPDFNSAVDFILKTSENEVIADCGFSVGQSLIFSLGNAKKISDANKTLKEYVRIKNNDEFRKVDSNFASQLIDFLEAPRYQVVGTQERMPDFLRGLESAGILSNKAISSGEDQIVNAGLHDPNECIDHSMAMDFYLNFPLDFVLWGIFFEEPCVNY